MRCRELSVLLNKANDILNLYSPDTELIMVLEDIKRLKEKEMKELSPSKEEANKRDEINIKEEIDKVALGIESFSISAIGNMLNSTELFPSMEFIRYFTKKIGVEISSRQSRTNSIHTIQRHLDRMRIDNTIAKRAD